MSRCRAGSALTADLIAADGMHLGGYIVPGMQLMKSSLQADTGKVRFDEGELGSGLDFGCSTGQAVSAGILAAQVGAANIAITEAKRRIRGDFAILLTGGDADQLYGHITGQVEIMPDLVLDGLVWLLP